MKKNKILIITWAILFVLFNVITFLVPNNIMGVTRFDKPVFWVAYAFIMICMIVQGIISFKFSSIENVGEKMFLHIPLVRTMYIGIALSVIFALLFMVIPVLPAWLGALVCVLLTAYLVVAAVRANTVAEAIEDVGKRVAESTSVMKEAVADAQIIMARSSEDEKPEIARLYEALRYSDYVSSPELGALDNSILDKMSYLKTIVNTDDLTEVVKVVDELLLVIEERNVKCKLYKHSQRQ